MSLLTIEKITNQALQVLEDELGKNHPTETHILFNNEGKYKFHKYSTGWVLTRDGDVLIKGMTDEEMWAHIKLLRS